MSNVLLLRTSTVVQSGPGSDPFPRTYFQPIAPGSGSGTTYAYANPTFQAAAAYFNIVCCNQYPGIEQTMGNTTFPTIFAAIKGLAAAKNIVCRCILYTQSSQLQTSTGTNLDNVLIDDVNTTNWWIRNGYPGGSIEGYDACYGALAITSQNAIKDANDYTIGQAYWWHFDNLLRQGNGVAIGYPSDLSFAANPYLDGYQMDNVFCEPRVLGSYGMNATVYAAGNATAAAWIQQGQAQQVAALLAINPNLLIWGNCDYFVHSTTNFSSQVTLDPTQLALWPIVYCQSAIGTPNGIEGQGSTTTAQLMANLIAAEALIRPGGTLLFEQTGPSYGAAFSSSVQADLDAADWQAIRFGQACCFMRNYHYGLNYSENYTTTGAWYTDECLAQGGVYGYLGPPGVADAPQTGARYNGAWYRVWQPSNGRPGGVVFMNPKENSEQTITLSSLGLSGLSAIGTLGYGVGTINTGNPVTSITLQPRDGRFLIFT